MSSGWHARPGTGGFGVPYATTCRADQRMQRMHSVEQGRRHVDR